MAENWCEFGKHPIEIENWYVIYSDSGVLNDVKMCRHCYALYVLEHYSQSHVANHMRNNMQNYGLTQAEVDALYEGRQEGEKTK